MYLLWWYFFEFDWHLHPCPAIITLEQHILSVQENSTVRMPGQAHHGPAHAARFENFDRLVDLHLDPVILYVFGRPNVTERQN